MRALITQSNYIPWRGYFDAIDRADVFVMYDDAQYTKRDWRNRNKIKTPAGLKWLSIPVKVKDRYLQSIADTEVLDHTWADAHWQTIRQMYRDAPYAADVSPLLAELYAEAASHTHLSQINAMFLERIGHWIGIDTPMRRSSEFDLHDGKTERLLGICLDLGATSYLSGPAAKGYLDVERFEAAGVAVEWMDYSGYPSHRQLHGDYVEGVTIVDTLMQLGPHARSALSHEGGHLDPDHLGSDRSART